jgi:plastocyanin domain-containing protein
MRTRIAFICAMLIAAVSFSVEAQKRRAPQPKSSERVQSVTVALTEKGYEPASFKLRPGMPAHITFVRKVEVTCATQIVIPEYNIKRELPLNEPVVIEIMPQKTGEYTFACGMNMFGGKVIVQ